MAANGCAVVKSASGLFLALLEYFETPKYSGPAAPCVEDINGPLLKLSGGRSNVKGTLTELRASPGAWMKWSFVYIVF